MRSRLLLYVLISVLLWKQTMTEICSSMELINQSVQQLRDSLVYEGLQDIMVKYVMHFEYNTTMTVDTGNGMKEIQRDEEILQFDDFLILSTVAVERTRQRVKDPLFRWDYPLHAFKFIHGNTELMQNIVDKMLMTFKFYNDKERTDKVQLIKNVIGQPPFPSLQDLNMATQALLDLQEIYALSSSEIANGELLGDGTEVLRAEECMGLAEKAKLSGSREVQISWLERARQLVEKTEDTSVERSHLYTHMYEAYTSAGCQCVTLADIVRTNLVDLHPENIYKYPNVCEEITDETCLQKLAAVNTDLRQSESDTESKFKKLCQQVIRSESTNTEKVIKSESTNTENVIRSESTNTENVIRSESTNTENVIRSEFTNIENRSIETSTLSCYFRRSHDPFYYMTQFKVETLGYKPRIELVHDFLRTPERQMLIHHGVTTLLAEDGKKKTLNLGHKVRASSITLTSKHQLKVESAIQQLIAAVSNTKNKSANKIFLTNYGIGGYDKVQNEESEFSTSRISVTIFLNKVSVGGDVVFPNLGLTVRPENKMALFVYNGETGSDITHQGACPVVKGNKWIAEVQM